jgi:hypothetical protein
MGRFYSPIPIVGNCADKKISQTVTPCHSLGYDPNSRIDINILALLLEEYRLRLSQVLHDIRDEIGDFASEKARRFAI